MAYVTRYRVETLTANGNAQYLAHDFCDGMHWSFDADNALEYDCAEEAETDASLHGGEVVEYGCFRSSIVNTQSATAETLLAAE